MLRKRVLHLILLFIFVLALVGIHRKWKHRWDAYSFDPDAGYQHPLPDMLPIGPLDNNHTPHHSTGNTSTTPIRAAMVALVRNSEMAGIRATIRQVDDRFNRQYGYPYIMLNDEDFTEEFKTQIRQSTEAKVYFGKLPKKHWGLSEYVAEEKVRDALVKNKDRYVYGGSYSYRLMCRYQSGFIHKHPLLGNLDYYWRIEPKVKYYCDISYDPFRYMKDNELKYGFVITPPEKQDTVETLWATTKAWMRENPQHLPDKSFVRWVLSNEGTYTLCHFWSNFEIVDLSLYRSEAYQSYFDHLDRAGGFFYERWGDAPVHSIAASMFLRKDQIHWFEDIGYRHPGYTHCPNKLEFLQHCSCDPGRNYMYRSVCKRWFDYIDDISKSQAFDLLKQSD